MSGGPYIHVLYQTRLSNMFDVANGVGTRKVFDISRLSHFLTICSHSVYFSTKLVEYIYIRPLLKKPVKFIFSALLSSKNLFHRYRINNNMSNFTNGKSWLIMNYFTSCAKSK